MSSTTELLKVSQMSIAIEACNLLRNITFTTTAGEIIALLGKNGSGKTTLFRSLIGYLPCTAGSVNLNNSNLYELSHSEIVGSICYVPQRLEAIPHTTVLEFLHSCSNKLSCNQNERINNSLERCSLQQLRDRYLPVLSGGELRRVLLATAFLSDASLLLLDEPTSNLDPANHIAVLNLIAQLASDSRAIIFATHDLINDIKIAHRIFAIRNKELLTISNTATALTPAVLESIYNTPFELTSGVFSPSMNTGGLVT